MDLARLDVALANLRERGDCQLRDCRHVGPGFISMPPHRVGIAHLTLRPRFLLGDPVGTGKTPQALVSWAFLREKDPTLRALVVTDKSALYQWRAAVDKFLVDVTASVVGYDEKKRSAGRDARRNQWMLDGADILITSWHSMALDIEVLVSQLDNFVLILDEVQRVRSHTGKLIHPAAAKLAAKARYTWGLTATPVYNSPEDLYGIFEVIKPGFFGPYSRFCESYVRSGIIKPRPGGKRFRPFRKVFGYKNLDHLAARIRPFYLKRPASVINAHLPSVVVQEVRLEMDRRQREVYDEVMVAGRLRGEELKSRLTALCYGQMASDAPQVLGYDGVKSSKLEELLRFFAEDVTDEKVIVYARYERVVTYVVDRLRAAGLTVARITGKESTAERERAKGAFNTPASGTNIIVINSAGGQAIDLQAAGIVIFYDLPWSYGELTQVVGRARRIGSSHEKVLVIMLANDHPMSIDAVTLKLLQAKEVLADDVLNLPDSELTLTTGARAVDHLWKETGGGRCHAA